MLEIRGIDVAYGEVPVIQDLSLSVSQGEIVALIGANGAGKSTILKTVSGLLSPRRGMISFCGTCLDTVEPHRRIEMGLAHVPEGRRLFPQMTVEENLDMGALRGQARIRRKETKDLVFTMFPRLKERHRQLAGTLSGGEQQMLTVGRGLMSRPRLLMFDEPSLGLAPILVTEIFAVIRKIRTEGTTVLIVEQNVPRTLGIADRAYVLTDGSVTHEGQAASLLQDEHIKSAYLGI